MSVESLFAPVTSEQSRADQVACALATIERFTASFNARNLEGMDRCLHFPHVILSGERMEIWDHPGQMPPDFFVELERSGWDRTIYIDQRPVLVSPRKVHVVVDYTRNRADGSIMSRHENLWIVTEQSGAWGIKQRSY